MKKIGLDQTFRFSCTRRAQCCRTGPNVALTIFDLVRIAKYLKKDWRELIPTYVKVIVADMVPFMLLRGIRDECIFLSKKGGYKCTIYPARPMRCRLYPIVPAAPGADYVYLDTKCPGLWSGPERKVPKKALEKYYEEVREHYKRIMKYVLEEGLEPEEALEKAIEDIWDQVSLEEVQGLELEP